ncbi:hypothetical protein [Leptospira perdikensis]|uniref:Glycosyltransferase RgtA/B/C/D-like domain-containing protein n=1 Tax=Leptospira perdikensis TaxID=2484948 RepID=A0A4R9JM82_9LEPT|nr:hypothetical protein [Leptospira perdikensis]TGL45042.1 hypothetical protein EHQ49_06170 [Leptospira perdikensis]
MKYQFSDRINLNLWKKKFLLFILLLVILPSILNNHPSRDIYLYDETFYLESADTLSGFQDAASYSFYYKMLSKIWKNPVERYFSNYLVLVLSLCFVFISIAKNSRELLLYSSFLSLIIVSPLIVSAMPFITMFSSVLIALAIYTYYNRRFSAFILISFVLTYARVEFYAFFLLSFVFVFLNLFNKSKKSLILPSLFYLLGLCIAILRNPSSQERAYIAFCQHYAFSKYQRGLYFDDPWTTCDRLLLQDFGIVGDLQKVLLGNFSALLEHIVLNIKSLFEVLAKNLNLPLYFVVTILVLTLFAEVYRLILNIRRRRLVLTLDSIFLFTFLGFSTIGSILYYPRDHYLLQILIVVIFFIKRGAILLEISFVRKKFQQFKKYLVLSGVIIFLLFVGLYFKNHKKMIISGLEKECGVLRLAETIKYLNLKEIHMLSPDGGLCVYLGNKNCENIYPYEKKMKFLDFIEKRKINIILLTEYYEKDAIYRDDSEFKKFRESNYKLNSGTYFEEVLLYTCKARKILVKKE